MSTNPSVSRLLPGQIHSCLHCRFFTRHLNLFERHVKRCSSRSSGPSSSSRLLPAPSVCRNYKCGKCSFVSNKAKLFLYHQRQVHGENIAVYGCNECEYASRHKNKVVRHKRLVHKVVSSPDDILALEDHSITNDSKDVMAAHSSETGNATDHQVGDSELKPDDGNRAYETKENNNCCSANQFQTANQPSLPREEMEASSASGPSAIGDGSIGEGSQQQGSPQKLGGDRMASFLSKWTLPKVNVVDGLYRCKFCRYSNPHKWKIASHMRTSHSRKTSYKCPQCNFVTERKIEWCTHKTLHSGKAVYSCNECAYQTTMKRNFERHQERHLVNGPRRCSLCSYSSTGEGAIQRHMAEYHPPSPGKGGENLQDEFEDKQHDDDDVAPNPNDASSLGSHCSSSVLNVHSSTPIHCSSAPPPPPPFCSSASLYSIVLPSLTGSSASSVVVPSSACPEEQRPMKAIPPIPLNSFRSFDIVQPPKSTHSSSTIASRSSESRWTCSLCPLGYKRAADLNRHMKRKHGVSLKDVRSSNVTGCSSSRSVAMVNCSAAAVSSGSMPNSLFTTSSIFSNCSIMSSRSAVSNNTILSNNSIMSGRSTVASSPINLSKEDQPLNLSLKNNVQSLDADVEQAEVLDLSTKTNSNCFHPSSDVVVHFRCKFCSFTTKKSSEFECHSLLHCSEKSHRCLICGKSYDTALDLTRHMTSMHQSSLLSSVGGRLALSCDIQQDVTAAAREVVGGGGTKNISSSDRSTPLKVESSVICNLPKEVKCSLLDTLEQNQHGPVTGLVTGLVAGLSCKFCRYVGKHPAELECHMKLHTADQPLRCHFCAYKTIWKSDMMCHLLKHHSEEAKNHANLRELLDLTSQPDDDDEDDEDDDKVCELRSISDDSDKDNDYVDYNMNVEMNDSGFLLEAAGSTALHSTSIGEKDGHKKLCKCPQCKFVCNIPLELKNHLEQHDNLRRFMCMHCGQRSSLLWDIRKHIRRFHPGVDMMIRELSEEEAKSLPTDENNQMIATKNDSKCLTSDTKSAFAKEELHLKSLPKEEPMDVEKIAEQYANEVAAMFYGISGPGTVDTSSASSLLQTWTGASTSQNAVAKKFGRPSKSLIMNRFRPFKCSECGRRSNWRWDLNKHIRASHPSAHLIELTETEAKSTFDEVLHRDIRERQQLMRMERTGGAKFKPYMCDSCGHRSNWKCDLNKHIKSLHPTAQVVTLDEEQAKDTIADYDALHAKLLKQEMCAERDVMEEVNVAAEKSMVAASVTVDSHKLKRFKCSACPYRSNFRSDVGRHIRHKHDKGTSRIVVMNEREAAETLKEYMETWARKKFVSSPSKRRSGGERRRMEQSFLDDFSVQQHSADGDNCRDGSSFSPTSTWLSGTEAGKGLENVGGGSDANNCLIGVNGGNSEDSKACPKSSVVFVRKKTEDVSGGASSMKSLSCSICPYQTSKTGLLNIHKTYHRPNGRNKYKCRYCPYYVCASRLLHQHMRLHLRENSTEKSDGCTRADLGDPVEAAALNEDVEEDPSALSCQESATRSLGRTTYCCLKCPYVSSNRNDYLYHRQFHRPRNTPAFKCDQCPYWVSQKRLLAQHAKVHSQEYRERHATSILTPWTTCVESKQEALHGNKETENEKSLSGNCGMVSSCGLEVESDNTKNSHGISDWENAGDLENQDKYQDQCDISEHQLVDTFECSDCPFLTSNHSMYEEHLNLHGSGQKFLCSECNFSVGTLNLLRQHRKLHEGKGDGMPNEKAAKAPNAEDDAHYNESRKAYCCDKCPYSNARRDHLLCHMKFHQIRSELQCSHCNYSVSRVHLLNQHLRVHGCGNGLTPSPNATRDPSSCGGSSRLRRARHRTEDLVPCESQTSFVVWMNQRQKQSAAKHMAPSTDRDADNCELSGHNGENWMKCVFMHTLQLQSMSPSGGEPESKVTGRSSHSHAFATFGNSSHSIETTTASQIETSSTDT